MKLYEMTDQIEFEQKDGYLLVTITDSVIIPQRAREILNLIGEESQKLKCNSVLLDERSVERRDVSHSEIMQLSKDMPKTGLNNINIAFWCKNNLIDEDAELLRVFTYTNEYIIKHFTDSDEAITWLKTKRRCQ